MSIIHKIRTKIREQEYEFAIPHFFEEMADDNPYFTDIETAVIKGRIRRKFRREPRGTRYEVVGQTTDGREIAIICRIKSTGKLLFITTYVLEE